MEQKKQKVDGVFEGGGVKGIGLVGATSAVEAAGYEFVNLAGTSAGAIVATLLAAKYPAGEMKDIITNFDFNSFMDEREGILDDIPLIGQFYSLLRWKGLYKGEVFLNLMRDLLSAKGVHTFGDLRRSPEELAAIDEDEREKYEYKVRVIATDITQRKMLVLPQDIKAYGQDPEKLEVAKAVRMSMSFPFFFEAVSLNGSLIVDGGVVSNFPVELFDAKAEPKWPTFGFKLMLPEGKNPAQLKQQSIDGPIAEFIAIVQTAMEAHDAYHLDRSKYVRTIGIDPLHIGTTDFSLSDRDKQALYQSGFKAAQEFLKTWDFEEYKKLYRSGKPLPTRREQLLPKASAGNSP